MIVDNDHLKFVYGIVLIDTTVDRALNPLLLIKAWYDDRHGRCKIGVNAYRTVERRKEITRQKECRRYDAVEIEPSVKFEIDDRLRTHKYNDECNNCKTE